MDRQGFRAMLQTHNVPDDKIEAAIAIVERFGESAEAARWSCPCDSHWY